MAGSTSATSLMFIGTHFAVYFVLFFSIADLVEFKDESLEATIKTCLSLGRKHIFDCERCKMKGTKIQRSSEYRMTLRTVSYDIRNSAVVQK